MIVVWSIEAPLVQDTMSGSATLVTALGGDPKMTAEMLHSLEPEVSICPFWI
jgi:hypothetical protein